MHYICSFISIFIGFSHPKYLLMHSVKQGASSEAINVSRQLISVVGTGLYHSMAEVQASVRSNCGSVLTFH